MAELCRIIRERTLHLLQHRALLAIESVSTGDGEHDPLSALAAASVQGRIAMGE